MQTQPMSDEEFLAAFLECRLDPRYFDHRAHVRVAWLILNQHALEDAVEIVCAGIQRYATHLGATGKFNRTLSEALVRLMAHHGAASANWEEFTRAHPQFLGDVRAVLDRHYSPQRLTSPEAKRCFVAPDREPLPPCQPRPKA